VHNYVSQRSRNDMAVLSYRRSGASSRTLNQEVFEEEFALAGVKRTAAAHARYITLIRRP
jgi:hypothetical protein